MGLPKNNLRSDRGHGEKLKNGPGFFPTRFDLICFSKPHAVKQFVLDDKLVIESPADMQKQQPHYRDPA